MGILDYINTDFLASPQGQALVSGLATYAATAQRGTPINNLGRGGLGAMMGYQSAMDTQKNAELEKRKRQMEELQYQQAMRTAAMQEQMLGYMGGMGGQNGSMPPWQQMGTMGAIGSLSGVPGSSSLVELAKLNKPEEPKWVAGDPRNGIPSGFVSGGQFNPYNPVQTPAQPQVQTAPMAQPQIEQKPLTPWTSAATPAMRDTLQTESYKDGMAQLKALRDGLTAGKNMIAEMDRFGELNREQRTGGLDDKFRPKGWTFDPEIQEMESISARLTPAQRPPGSGATSDFEQKLYALGTVGVDKEGNVNKGIRKQAQKLRELAEAELAFKEQFFADNGHLNGADEAWNEIKRKKSLAEGKLADIPPAAIDYLKRNYKMDKDLLRQFDEKYGEGAAALILGTQ